MVFYAGLCTARYWDTGSSGFFLFGLASLSLGITLDMLDTPNYGIAIANLLVAIMGMDVVIRSESLYFIYLPLISIMLAVATFLHRRKA